MEAKVTFEGVEYSASLMQQNYAAMRRVLLKANGGPIHPAYWAPEKGFSNVPRAFPAERLALQLLHENLLAGHLEDEAHLVGGPELRKFATGWTGPCRLNGLETVVRATYGRLQVYEEDPPASERWMTFYEAGERVQLDTRKPEVVDLLVRRIASVFSGNNDRPDWGSDRDGWQLEGLVGGAPDAGEWWLACWDRSGHGAGAAAKVYVPQLRDLRPGEDDAKALAAIARAVLGLA